MKSIRIGTLHAIDKDDMSLGFPVLRALELYVRKHFPLAEVNTPADTKTGTYGLILKVSRYNRKEAEAFEANYPALTDRFVMKFTNQGIEVTGGPLKTPDVIP